MSNLLDKASILLSPNAYNNGSMLSVKPTDGDGDFTFVRGSAATRVNAQGLVENVQIINGELVINGDFATDTNWFKDANWTIANGKATSTGNGRMFQSIPFLEINVGVSVKVTFDIIELTQGGVQVNCYGGISQTFTTLGTHTFFTTTTNGSNLYFNNGGAGSNFIGSIDNCSVKQVTDDTNLPRINYEGFSYDGNGDIIPDSGCGSWLLEPQSTNLITNSESFDSYKVFGAAVTPNSTTSPDGNNSGVLITRGSNELALRITNVLELSKTYTFSGYFKSSDSATEVALDITDNNTTTFNLTNEWQRFSMTAESKPSGNGFVDVSFGPTSANGDTFYAWGLQAEEQSFATSYIPTEGATNTRNQDIATDSGNATLINSTEGVLYAEIDTLADGVNGRYISIGDGSLSNYVYIRITGNLNEIKMGIVKGGSTQASKSFTVPNLKQSNKLAVSYQQDLFRFYVNGTLIFTDTNGDIFPIGTLNALTFNLANTNNYFNGKNKCVAVYKEALTDAELQSLTTI